MSRLKSLTLITAVAGVTAVAFSAAPLAACGKIGPLDQPAPLFGERAKAAYYAQRADQARATAHADDDQRNATGSAERTVANDSDATTNVTGAGDKADPNADNTPLTTRDIQDPDQKLTTPRNAPVPGAPNSMGPMPTTTPPG